MMKKACLAAILLAILFCLEAPRSMAEEEEISFQQLMQVETPTPSPDPAEGLPAVVTPTPAPEIRYESDGSVVITLSAVGDVTIGRNVQSSSTIFQREMDRQGGDINFIFRNIKSIFENDDLTIVNFEGVLADSYTIPSRKKENSFLFLAPPSYASALRDNSVEVATIENNHIDDFGDQGRTDTQSALDDVGVQWADEFHSMVYETQGIRIAVLAYKTFDYYSTLFDKVPREIGEARKQADLVVCCFHWGAEKDYAPNANQQKLGRLAIDSGADLVIGHHSHRINPIEQYNGKYIVYSVGNFSFAGNSKPDDMSTFIFQTRFRFKDGELISNPFRIIPCRISSKSNENDFAPTPYDNELQINNVVNTMLKNGSKLEYAVSEYPLDWE
ncbi:MAG: CapA family protein [Clostridia bacterium]|nr:CapA family protein [Clostridia bacterium]